MIQIDRVNVSNLENAFHGLRNPMNSWNKSDSFFGFIDQKDIIDKAQKVAATYWDESLPGFDQSIYDEQLNYLLDNGTSFDLQPFNCGDDETSYAAFIGRKDLELGKRMVLAGNDEGKFARQIFVSMDIDLPLAVWKELDQYKVGTTTNSCSTMHKLTSTPITRECFSFDENFDKLPIYTATDADSGIEISYNLDLIIEDIINNCEKLRQLYNETKDIRYWRALVMLLPEGWNQKRTWTANYQVLRNIYFARRNHKLTEWHDFCHRIELLPYAADLITCER